MAYLKLYKDKLKHNYQFLDKIFKDKNIEWGIVSKVLCGHKEYLSQLIDLGIHEIHDSRISNLVTVKKLNPEVQTVYIKPPAKRSIPKVVRYADVSFNTEMATIKMISEEAVKQNKIHKIIIMIEMGDLREGVMGEDLVEFYEKIFKQPGISVVGLGTNLNCLHGVIPNPDKLIQISLYKQIIEAKFNRRIPWVSGGTSVVFPLLLNRQLPSGINHFRMGETLFFGNNLLTNENIEGMETGVFELFTEIIELAEKPTVPIGEMGQNVMGETTEVDEELYGETTTRAIIDIGQLDIDPKFLKPRDKDVEIVGASSDMLVLDIGDNKHGYKVGDLIAFKLEYMGVLGIMNSNYITKLVVD